MTHTQLDTIARRALEHYNKKFVAVEFFAKETSTIYKAIDAKSRAYALKIYDEASSNSDDNIIEVLILEAIANSGSIPVAELIENRGGEKVTLVTDPRSKATRRAVLSRWLGGVDWKGNESEAGFIRLGALTAELHRILSEIAIPGQVRPKKWDQVFYFRDEKPVYKEAQHREKAGPEFEALMDAAVPVLDEHLQRIYGQEPPQLLHGDLNPWNIKTDDGTLSILDFEDSIYGPRVHDLAILLYYYRDDPEHCYERVKGWILEGYARISPAGELRDGDFEILFTARLANFLNHVLTLDEDYREFIESGLSRLRAFLQREAR